MIRILIRNVDQARPSKVEELFGPRSTLSEVKSGDGRWHLELMHYAFRDENDALMFLLLWPNELVVENFS